MSIEGIPEGAASSCSASVSIFAKVASGLASLTASKTGANWWHGRHQSAQKSSSTMPSETVSSWVSMVSGRVAMLRSTRRSSRLFRLLHTGPAYRRYPDICGRTGPPSRRYLDICGGGGLGSRRYAHKCGGEDGGRLDLTPGGQRWPTNHRGRVSIRCWTSSAPACGTGGPPQAERSDACTVAC